MKATQVPKYYLAVPLIFPLVIKPFMDSKNLQIMAHRLLLNKSRYRCRLFIFSPVTCFSDKRDKMLLPTIN